MLLWNKLSRCNTNILTLISIFNLSYRYTRKPGNISTLAIWKGSSRTGSNLLQHPREISFHFRVHQRCTTTSSFQQRPMDTIWGENSGICSTQCTQRPQPGTLYLITGTAFGHIQNNPSGYNLQEHINNLSPAGNFPAINIANSMWTAGCCVHPNGVESFAMMGNNLQNVPRILTQQITVARLQMIFEHDEDNIGQNINGPNIDLFPGNVACSNVNNNHPALPPWNGR